MVAGATSVGRVRLLNEDAFLAGSRIFAVADGMGGHAAGDVASRLAIEFLTALDGEMRITTDVLLHCLHRVNAAILEHGERHPEATGLGSTIVGLARTVDEGGSWVVFHVGDSRAYRWRADLLERLTTDHSEVQELVAAGAITPAEAEVHPSRHVITRALGQAPPATVDLRRLSPSESDLFLLASDGLTSSLSDELIAHVLDEPSSLDEKARRLVVLAEEHGGEDNITVVLVVPTGGPEPAAHRESSATTIPRSSLMNQRTT